MAKRAKYGKAKEDNYNWYDMLNQYANFKKENGGRNPKSSGASEKEVRLYYWMYNQTRLIKNGRMSRNHITALVNAGVDIPNEGNLIKTYTRNVRAFAKKRPEKGSSLYLWALKEQKRYEDGSLADEYISIWKEYVELEDFERFGVNNQKWLEKLSVSDPKWVERQNVLYRENRLRRWQCDLLMEHGLIFKRMPKKVKDPRHANCMTKRCAEYKAFLKENGRKPKQGGEKDEKALYMWGRDEIKAIRAGKRSARDIKILKSLGICA